MRWGERAAAGRDDLDASLHVAHQPQREITKAPHVVTKPAPKPALTGTAFGRNVRPGKAGTLVSDEPFSASLSGSTRVEDPATIISARASQWPLMPSSFLVCAGKSVSSNNDEEASENPAKHAERRVYSSNVSDPVKKAPTQSLQRSDSELELIISELREKISLRHRSDEEKRKAASHKSSEASATGGALDSSRSTESNSEPHHPRRHLKNPVERVHGNTPPVGSLGLSMSSSSSILLKRQQSSSSVPAGNGTRLAPPTVIATAIGSFSSSSASRSNLAMSASVAGNLLHHSSGSILNDRDLEAHCYSRVYDDEGLLIKSYAQEPNNNIQTTSGVQRPIVYHNNVVRARRVRRISSESERKTFSLHLEPQRQGGGNNASDSDSSFSDDDGGNSFLLQGSLSPMGPWMVADDRQSPESLGSLDSSHLHPGSARFDLSPTSARFATEDEFAELSPRSRLLWFSAFAEIVEYSSESFGSSSSTLRQCQSHPGTLLPSSAGANTSGSKPPVRCSSAKSSSLGRREGTGSSESNGTKGKSGGAAVQIKKRPQSGGLRARKVTS